MYAYTGEQLLDIQRQWAKQRSSETHWWIATMAAMLLCIVVTPTRAWLTAHIGALLTNLLPFVLLIASMWPSSANSKCPACDSTIHLGSHDNFCPACGVALRGPRL